MRKRIKNVSKRILFWSEGVLKTDATYLAQGTFWLSLNQVVAISVGVLTSVLFAHYLSQHEFGVYKYLMTLSTFLGAFSLVGMSTSLFRSVSMGYDGNTRHLFWYQLKWNLRVMLPLAFILAGYYLFQNNSQLGIGLITIGLLAPFTNATNTYSAYLAGKGAFKKTFFYNGVVLVSGALAVAVGTIVFKSALMVIGLFMFVQLITQAWAYRATLKVLPPNSNIDPTAKPLGKHLTVINLIDVVAQNIDKILAFQVLGSAALAVYSFAVIIPAQFGGFGKIISNLAFKKISFRIQNKESIQYKRKVFQLLGVMLLAVLVYIPTAPYLYKSLFPQYIEAISYSQLSAIIFIFTVPALYVANILNAFGKTKYLYQYKIVSSIVRTVLMISLGYYYALSGLVFAHIFSACFDLLYAIWIVEKIKKNQEETLPD